MEEMPPSDLVFLGPSPVGVDASYLWKGQLKETLFWLIQEADPFPIYGNNEVVLWQAGSWKYRKNSLSVLYKSSPIDLISVLYSQAPGITWKLSDFKESGKKQRPLKASKIYKLLLHSLGGEMVLCVWGLQDKKHTQGFLSKIWFTWSADNKNQAQSQRSQQSSTVTGVKGTWRK